MPISGESDPGDSTGIRGSGVKETFQFAKNAEVVFSSSGAAETSPRSTFRTTFSIEMRHSPRCSDIPTKLPSSDLRAESLRRLPSISTKRCVALNAAEAGFSFSLGGLSRSQIRVETRLRGISSDLPLDSNRKSLPIPESSRPRSRSPLGAINRWVGALSR